jgi:hypothetical protein
MPRDKGQATGPAQGEGPRGRGARAPSNPTGERKQGGRKASRKSTLTRAADTGRKRSGAESGGTKKKARGGRPGAPKGARGR